VTSDTKFLKIVRRIPLVPKSGSEKFFSKPQALGSGSVSSPADLTEFGKTVTAAPCGKPSGNHIFPL
jgi:hypothetical protein